MSERCEIKLRDQMRLNSDNSNSTKQRETNHPLLLHINSNKRKSVFCKEGDDIEFNSDPDDNIHPESHTHRGQVIEINNNVNTMKIQSENQNKAYLYFMDDIHIIKNNKNNNNTITRQKKRKSLNCDEWKDFIDDDSYNHYNDQPETNRPKRKKRKISKQENDLAMDINNNNNNNNNSKKADLGNNINSDMFPWYFRSDAGKFELTNNYLSNMISNLEKGKAVILSFKNQTYSVRKIAYNHCIQTNTKTKKVRDLRMKEYAWFYPEDNGCFASCTEDVNLQLIASDIQTSFQFSTGNGDKYEMTKISIDVAIQKNLKTGFFRNVERKLKFNININNDKIRSGDNKLIHYKMHINNKKGEKKHVNTLQEQSKINDKKGFIAHMKYEEVKSLKVGDKIDLRSHSGYFLGGKVSEIEMRENVEGLTQKFMKIHYDGYLSKHEQWINIDKQYNHELYRFAKYRSISIRASHRLKNVKIGDFVDVNPIYSDPGWKFAEITKKSIHSGQIEVKFTNSVKKKSKSYWIHLDNNIECADFGRGQIDKKQVQELFYWTVSPSKYEIIEIKDIWNKDNVNVYESILRGKCKNDKDIHEMEKYLWHGTKSIDTLELIMKNGFDRSYNKVGKYGKGTYFAKKASYCIEGGFCGRDDDDIYFILLCRVITGQYIKGKKKMKTMPKKEDGTEYECLVNNVDNPAIFVSWRDYHALPYYLIKFKNVKNNFWDQDFGKELSDKFFCNAIDNGLII